MVKVVVLGLGMKYIFRVILRTINIKMELQSFLELNLEIFFFFYLRSVSSSKLSF